MGFVIDDLAFLGVFCLFVIIFLSTRKKNLQRQGLIFLYKTQLGVKFMDTIAKKFEKILRPMRYVVVFCGYSLLVAGLWMIIKTAYLYIKYPITDYIKAPPIAPLIPY